MKNKTQNNQIFDMVLFGATGDLVRRKLLPALYNAFIDKSFNPESRIFCIGRHDISTEGFCLDAYKYAIEAKQEINDDSWNEFIKQINYIKINLDIAEDYINLKNAIDTKRDNIYYLSTAPSLFKAIVHNLANVELNHDNSRIVLEKPLGNDLESSIDINDYVAKYFSENQIYRIDHFLGKESVQNLMAIRFGNTLFEALWRRQWIHSVQITVAEDLGVGSRGDFYENKIFIIWQYLHIQENN